MGYRIRFFLASWCKYSPYIEKYLLESGLVEELGILMIPMDENLEEFKQFRVTQVPAMLMSNGTVLTDQEEIWGYIKHLEDMVAASNTDK